jgi:hypothetical protein
MAFCISSSFIRREALAISTVPFIKEAIPVPEPPPVTESCTAGFISWYFSAQAKAKLTIVSDPLFSMVEIGAEEPSEGGEIWEQPGKNNAQIETTNNMTPDIFISQIIFLNEFSFKEQSQLSLISGGTIRRLIKANYDQWRFTIKNIAIGFYLVNSI